MIIKKIKILKNRFGQHDIDGYIIPKMMSIFQNMQKMTG